jgi:poly(3-hydroxybutyrate) depolymerase
MKKKYNIDPQRVYAAGVSGGGRVASMLGVCFSDIFTGGYYMVGCNFYRQEKVPDSNEVFFRSYNVPPTKIFVQAKKNKHVFLTGDTDGNRVQTQVYYEGFKHDGFEHITYIQVPGMGHGAPDPEWFEKGLKALDEPLPAPGAAKPPAAQRATTRPAPPAATQNADPAAIAKQLLATARLYLDNKQFERGREKLKWIVDHYPGTPAAAEAQKLLKQTDGAK